MHPSWGTPCDINATYTSLKSTFSGRQFRRWQYGSIFIRLAAIASKTREMSRMLKTMCVYRKKYCHVPEEMQPNLPEHSSQLVHTKTYFADSNAAATLAQSSCWREQLRQEFHWDILPTQQPYQSTGDNCQWQKFFKFSTLYFLCQWDRDFIHQVDAYVEEYTCSVIVRNKQH